MSVSGPVIRHHPCVNGRSTALASAGARLVGPADRRRGSAPPAAIQPLVFVGYFMRRQRSAGGGGGGGAPTALTHRSRSRRLTPLPTLHHGTGRDGNGGHGRYRRRRLLRPPPAAAPPSRRDGRTAERAGGRGCLQRQGWRRATSPGQSTGTRSVCVFVRGRRDASYVMKSWMRCSMLILGVRVGLLPGESCKKCGRFCAGLIVDSHQALATDLCQAIWV